VQQFKDEHIVRLIKAYGHGESINLVFPKAWTNLDHLLRNRKYGYGDKRGAKLELADAWTQLLGIFKALKKIHGFSNSQANGTVDDQLCIHFDLKPDNILIERENGNWLITDFGQAALTKRRRGTTPRIGGHFGTDAYAPPEIDDMSMEFGRAYDIWSLGCIVLEVATFMVLGYAGLSGAGSFTGLDQARQAMPKWAKNRDERFFCQEVPNGEYVVKKDVQAFMVNLESSHARSSDCDDESKAFLKKIIDLINRMLKPKATERVDITRVVEILSSARRNASAGVIQHKPHRVVAEPGEYILKEAELSQIELWHWSAANKEWEGCSLAILKSEAEYMRLHCGSRGNIPKDINIPRAGVKMVPLYAFWDPTKLRGSKAWIDLLALSADRCSAIPNAKFAFDGGSGLDDARLIQSVLTSQNIVGSFALSRFVMRRRTSATAAISRIYHKIKSNHASTPVEADSKLFELNSATIQIWVEQQDASPVKITRRESQASQATTLGRPVRRSDRDQPKVPPCRLCIYLHEPQFICTIRIDVNWVLKEGMSDNKLHLRPRTSGGSGTFYASWLRPTPSERAAKHPAGIPLDPRVLRYHEDCDFIELEDVELTFLNENVLAAFRSKYDHTKEAWAIQRKAKEDRTEVNGRPEDTPQIPAGMTRLPVPKAKVSIFASIAEEEHFESMSSASNQSKHDSTIETQVGHRQNPALLVVPPDW
jgi:serine/threonine protein kinase